MAFHTQASGLAFATQDALPLTAADPTATAASGVTTGVGGGGGLSAAFADFGAASGMGIGGISGMTGGGADAYLAFADFGAPSQGGASVAWPDAADAGAAAAAALRFDDGFGAGGLGGDDDDEGGEGREDEPPPEWACAYCGASSPASVVKCVATGKWFCNGRVGAGGTCAVVHLVRSRRREVQLHPEGPLGDAILECYASGTRNVFVLGFVPTRSGDGTVVLLSRDTPPNAPAVKELGVDMAAWQPVIADRAFVPWLVAPPPDAERLRARRLTPSQIGELEELWKTRPDAVPADLGGGADGTGADGAAAAAAALTPVALRYADAAEYQSVFAPLIGAEAEYDRAAHEQQRRDGIRVRWGTALNRRRVAMFYFPQDDVEVRLLPGDELRLRHKAAGARGAWEGTGYVVGVANGVSEEVQLEMSKADVPEDVAEGYSLEFVWKSTTFDRMRGAIKLFRGYAASISGYLFHTLLGHAPPPGAFKPALPKDGGLGAPGLPELNHSQLAAVRAALSAPLSLIQGPPGTGKTVTSAAIVYHLARSTGGQVLVAAPSNVAVDQLAEKVAATGLRVVRVCARAREAVAGPVEHLTLHYQIANLGVPGAEVLRKLSQLKAEKGGLSAADERQFMGLRHSLEREVLAAADVVCCTCAGAGDPRLARLRFTRVLLDEATQASEPEALLPLVLGAKQAVLVGDHCQLGPVVMCKRAAAAGLGLSLFERLRLLGVRPLRLQVQYRMHPCLSAFPSNTFYEGALQNGAGAGDRAPPPGMAFPWPDPRRPMMFWAQAGAEEISASGTSYLNRAEAANVERLLTRLLSAGVQPRQLGVITPYEGQRAHVAGVLARCGALRQDLYRAVEVSSVDAFQGREKDYIIVSCVRSSETGGVGFLGDPRRLNVALTRARYGLVLLGNPRVLGRSPLWAALLSHFREQDLLVEGPLTNLKPSLAPLPAAQRRFDRAAFGVDAAPPPGGLGAVGRYHPTERVGDAPLPPAAAAAAADASLPGYNPYAAAAYAIPTGPLDHAPPPGDRRRGAAGAAAQQTPAGAADAAFGAPMDDAAALAASVAGAFRDFGLSGAGEFGGGGGGGAFLDFGAATQPNGGGG